MRRLRTVAGFLPDCIVLFARLARDPRTSRSLTLLLVVSGAYLAFPIDLIPDFIPVARPGALARGLATLGGAAVLADYGWETE